MNRERILTEARQLFSGLTNVSENLYKGELKVEEKTAGVYFIDLNGNIRSEDFKDYQEKILYEEYYKQDEELQWNLYLLLITDKPNFKEKEIIENNQKYARKYVFTETEFLDFFKLDQEAGIVQSDILVRWKKELDKADLQEVYGNDTYVDAVTRFLANSTLKITNSSSATKEKDALTIDFIRTLNLHDSYKRSLAVKNFEFGRVNLLKGVNGSGKTSTLEAIELVACGKTCRNWNVREEDGCITATINKGAKETCTPSNNTKYRIRDQAWYSNTYSRDNFVYTSFNRFNFFDSDAASNFSQSNDEEKVKEALENLILGGDFKYVKERVNGFSVRLNPEYNKLSELIRELKEKISRAEIILKTQKESGTATLLAEVNSMLQNLKLKEVLVVNVDNLDQVDILLNRIKAIGDRILSSKSPSNKTPKLLTERLNEIEKRISVFEEFIKQLSVLDDTTRKTQESLPAITEKSSVLETVIKILETPKLLELEGWSEKITSIRRKITGISKIEEFLAPIAYPTLRRQGLLRSIINTGNEQILNLGKEIGEISTEISNRLQVLGSIDALISEIRNKGKELISIEPERDHCPLCNTHFEKDDLQKRIDELLSAAVSDGKVENVNTLQTRRTEKENELRKLEQEINEIKLLEAIYKEVINGDIESIELNTIIDEIENFYSDKFVFQSMQTELESLERLGNENKITEQSIKETKGLLDRLFKNKFLLSVNDIGQIKKEYDSLQLEVSNILRRINELKSKREDLSTEIKKKLELPLEDTFKTGVVKSSLAGEKEEIASLQNNYGQLKELVEYSDTEIIDDLSQKVGLVVNNIASLRTTIAADFQMAQAKRDMDDGERFIKANERKLSRLKVATELLSRLNNSGGSSEMGNFFVSNFKQIIEVFKMIHTPREFVNLIYDNGVIKLVDTKKETRLVSQISTGQRAALALSIFICMNRMLKNGPNIILFDDPVSHIDDLNALSFLDFLRIFVLKDKKQIFFASANTRLAKLFERKFEFLGEGFKQWKLTTIDR